MENFKKLVRRYYLLSKPVVVNGFRIVTASELNYLLATLSKVLICNYITLNTIEIKTI